MRSSHDALYDETRPLRLLDDERSPQPPTRNALLGAALVLLLVVLPVLAIGAL